MNKIHDKKVKGDIASAHIIARLTELNWNVAVPLSEHQKYDLLIEKNGIIKRVQCKYSYINQNGKVSLNISTNWNNKSGSHKRNREIGDYDILAIYVVGYGVCFLTENHIGKAGTSITIRTSKNNILRKDITPLIFDELLKVDESDIDICDYFINQRTESNNIKKKNCVSCGVAVASGSRCVTCANKEKAKNRVKINWPNTDDLIKMVNATSYTYTAKTLGVSDNAIRKRIHNHPIDK